MIENPTRNLFSKVYAFYRYKIFYRINHLRGSSKLAGLLNRLARTGLEKIHESDSTSIHDLEWDYIFILDACRADYYQELSRDCQTRISKGSSTRDFLRENFSDGNHEDIVYISANPHLNQDLFREITENSVEEVFHCVFHTYEGGWDAEKKTVPPNEVLSDVRTAEQLFPNKRKIIHLMQPHHPFVGGDMVETGFNILENKDEENEWSLAEMGEIAHQEVSQAYLENLEFVMNQVEGIENSLDGRILITSDHGNLVGENGLYGHPSGSKAKVLREVPLEILDE